MPGMPVATGNETVRALERAGWLAVYQKGSHVKLVRGGGVVIVPRHRKPLRPGTLRAIIRQAGLTPEQFTALL